MKGNKNESADLNDSKFRFCTLSTNKKTIEII